MRGLTRGEVRDVDGLGGGCSGFLRFWREEKFEFVEMSVSEKLSDDRVSESDNNSVVFVRPTF